MDVAAGMNVVCTGCLKVEVLKTAGRHMTVKKKQSMEQCKKNLLHAAEGDAAAAAGCCGSS